MPQAAEHAGPPANHPCCARCAGMLDDALREYFELEAVYLEILQASHLTRQGFGSKAPDADEAALMWRSWHGIRQVGMWRRLGGCLEVWCLCCARSMQRAAHGAGRCGYC